MSRYSQQWHGFAAWANTLLGEPARESVFVRPALLVNLEELPRHGSHCGKRCPRCQGQVLRTHPGGDATCLQCGFEPIQWPPAPYVFEPYDDNAATSRAAFVPEPDLRNGPVTVRVAREPLSPLVCVGCGAVVGGLKVHRCPDCYRQYCADLSMRAF